MGKKNMATVGSVIAMLVAPAGMIVANSILLGSVYDRIARLIAQTRTFNEKIEDIVEKQVVPNIPRKLINLYHRQIRDIRHQASSTLRNADMTKKACYMFELSILFNLLTGFVAALTLISNSTFIPLSLVFSGISMILLITGICYTIGDVYSVMGPIQREFDEVIEMTLENLKMNDDF